MPDAAALIDATPPPVHPRADPPTHYPPRLAPHEQARIRAAVHAAKRRHPGPVGEILADYLTFYVTGGWRVDPTSKAARLADELLRPR